MTVMMSPVSERAAGCDRLALATGGRHSPGVRRDSLSDLSTADICRPVESPEDILKSGVRVTKRLLGVDVVFAALPCSNGGYRVTAQEGLLDCRWDSVNILSGCKLAATAIETRRGVLLSDYTETLAISDHYRSVVAAEGLRALACAPALSSSGDSALFYIGQRRSGGLTIAQFEEFQSIVNATGLVLATAARHREFSRQLDMIAGIARSAAQGTEDAGELRTALARICAAANGHLDQGDSGIHVTPRERDVLQLLAQGASNRMIATRLVLSETTIKGYIHTLLSKFDAGSRLEIVAIARRRGMI